MNRRTFLIYGGAFFATLGGANILQFFNQSNIRSEDISRNEAGYLDEDCFYILYMASFAPSGHNTQPWTVKVIDNNHWIIGTEKSRWLPAIDPGKSGSVIVVRSFSGKLGHCRRYQGI